MHDYYRTLGTVRLRFVWAGGPYIDVHEVGWSAAEVINVWDYAKNEPTIEQTDAALRAECERWITTYGDAETPLACMAALEHDVMEHWRMTAHPNTRGGKVGVSRRNRPRPDHTHPSDFKLSSGHLHDAHNGAFEQASKAGVSPKTWHERQHAR
jgi:hypothetical protein